MKYFLLIILISNICFSNAQSQQRKFTRSENINNYPPYKMNIKKEKDKKNNKDIFTVDTTYTPAELVQNNIANGCIEVSNIIFNGNIHQAGYFNGGNSTIGISNGIVLSTGNVKNAEGPNSSIQTSTDYSGNGDSLIDNITGANASEDAASIEFDIKLPGNNLIFNYSFASEEYNEYSTSTIGDAMGIFLSGPSPTGGTYINKNIALIPGTSTPVMINTVNDDTNSTYFYENADGHLNIECDGLTKVLNASASVNPLQWYHIKIVIADVTDGIYDSWVFIKANLAEETSTIAMNITNPTNDKDIYEGCTSDITFSRNSSIDINTPITINYTLSGTTTQGDDYITLLNPVIIPAGSMSVTFSINTIVDGITESTETIIFTTNVGGCPDSLITLSDTIYLNDFIGISGYIQETNEAICAEQSITLHGIITTGNYYQGTWTNNSIFISHNQNITVTPITTTTYNFSATDSCGNTFNHNIIITVDPIPPTPVITYNNNILSSTSATGYQWYNASGLLAGITSQTFTPTSSGNYYVIITDSNGCVSAPSNIIHIDMSGIDDLPGNSGIIYFYPNPVKNNITIEKNISNKNEEISIYNIQGKALITQPLIKAKTIIDISSFAQGIYFIKVKTDKGDVVKKIIKE